MQESQLESGLIAMEVPASGSAVGNISVSRQATKRDLELAALGLPAVKNLIGETTVLRIVVEPGVFINIVK